ncbi:MAG: pyridoxal 5'-phosphate synthase glutaminase subunit PdxT [Chlamydiales bacterium]
MVGDLTLGVLALQGAFAKHEEMLQAMGIKCLKVVDAEALLSCDGLILPGGESTTMNLQIHRLNLLQLLKERAQVIPFFGTCAGMILMAQKGALNLLDIEISRNAYGNQSASFSTELEFFSGKTAQALFIRAPRIISIHSTHVKVLAQYEGEAVCVQQKHHLACAFHPELTNNFLIHQYFVHLCINKKKQSLQQPSKITPTRSSLTI